MNDTFEITDFLPYLLNQAADASALEFQAYYKSHYGMLRTEWRVLFHLGHYGPLTAKDICTRARLHKTKVSRAVHALERKRFLTCAVSIHDRRHEDLSLTKAGRRAFDDLATEAERFDGQILGLFNEAERRTLRKCLKELARM